MIFDIKKDGEGNRDVWEKGVDELSFNEVDDESVDTKFLNALIDVVETG